MLYQLHDLHNAALTPARLAAEAGQHVFRNPYNPFSYSTAARAWAAACDVFEHSTRPYGKPSFGIAHTPVGDAVATVEEEVIDAHPFCDLLHFKRSAPAAQDDPKLLIVAPMSGHFATLLRDTVRALMPDHDVYITDWIDARMIPVGAGRFDLDDYVDLVIRFLQRLGSAHVMAVCQPSVPVLAAVSLMAAADDPASPRSMTLMGGPIDTRRNPTVPNKLAQKRSLAWFEHSVLQRVPLPHPGFMRRVYPGFLQLTGFMSMNLDKHVAAHMRQFHDLVKGDGDSAAAHRAFYAEYRAVMDLPAEYYLQTVDIAFQRHLLPDGKWISRGRPVRPAAIRKTALMTVEGEHDDISGVGQTQAAQDICTAIPARRRAHYLQAGVGHYGVFNGSRWRREIAPRVAAFIRMNDH